MIHQFLFAAHLVVVCHLDRQTRSNKRRHCPDEICTKQASCQWWLLCSSHGLDAISPWHNCHGSRHKPRGTDGLWTPLTYLIDQRQGLHTWQDWLWIEHIQRAFPSSWETRQRAAFLIHRLDELCHRFRRGLWSQHCLLALNWRKKKTHDVNLVIISG